MTQLPTVLPLQHHQSILNNKECWKEIKSFKYFSDKNIIKINKTNYSEFYSASIPNNVSYIIMYLNKETNILMVYYLLKDKSIPFLGKYIFYKDHYYAPIIQYHLNTGMVYGLSLPEILKLSYGDPSKYKLNNNEKMFMLFCKHKLIKSNVIIINEINNYYKIKNQEVLRKFVEFIINYLNKANDSMKKIIDRNVCSILL